MGVSSNLSHSAVALSCPGVHFQGLFLLFYPLFFLLLAIWRSYNNCLGNFYHVLIFQMLGGQIFFFFQKKKQTKKKIIITLKGIVSVINYSPSCRSKPVRLSFIFGTQIKICLIKSENIAVVLLSMEGQRALDLIKNNLICIPKMNEGLTGLERHEGE